MKEGFYVRASLALFGLTCFSFILLSNINTYADNVVDEIRITVPTSCTLSSSGENSHTDTLRNNQSKSDIGTTTLSAFCNDPDGFAIYAIGYTDNTYGKTVMSSSLNSQYDIATGTGTSGNSQWAMKLATNNNATYPITIQNSFDSYHVVPSNYTLVAKRTSGTDVGTGAIGSALTSTYQVYASSTQPAATYTGKVRYTMVHPNNADPPIDPRYVATFDMGQNVNVKLKTLAGATNPSYSTQDNTITALKRANALPSGFTPSTANTISTSDSALPIYAWYDSSDTTIYYYSEANRIYMNESSGDFFREMRALSDLSTIATWDTSKVTNMSLMFSNAGRNATTWSVGDLSSWNTASVTNMSYMFNNAGYNATTFDLGDLSSWGTASVTNMSYMFNNAGYNATTFDVGDLSSWSTASVANMSYMFSYAGYSATTFDLGDLSSWGTASVTNMSNMFNNAGHNATIWSVGDLSSWSTASVTNMSTMFQSAGYNATTFDLGDLSSWSTASVANMSYMFNNAGYNATTFDVGDLSSWNTASVTNMSYMFQSAGYSATTFTLDLSSWNTASVTSMSNMFSYAGYSATTWSIGNLSSWNTASVTNMQSMFSGAGYSATTFTLNLSSWNTSNVTNMSQMFPNAGRSATTWSVTIPKTNGAATPIDNTTARLYGKSTSTYAVPPSGKSFTLAN